MDSFSQIRDFDIKDPRSLRFKAKEIILPHLQEEGKNVSSVSDVLRDLVNEKVKEITN